MRTAKRQRLIEARGSTDFVADARICNDDKLVLFLRHFSTRTKIYKDGGALDFIDELHRRWYARDQIEKVDMTDRQTTVSAAGATKPGVVFLS
jgi:zona occludens toxin (predicted ATPase)